MCVATEKWMLIDFCCTHYVGQVLFCTPLLITSTYYYTGKEEEKVMSQRKRYLVLNSNFFFFFCIQQLLQLFFCVSVYAIGHKLAINRQNSHRLKFCEGHLQSSRIRVRNRYVFCIRNERKCYHFSKQIIRKRK